MQTKISDYREPLKTCNICGEKYFKVPENAYKWFMGDEKDEKNLIGYGFQCKCGNDLYFKKN